MINGANNTPPPSPSNSRRSTPTSTPPNSPRSSRSSSSMSFRSIRSSLAEIESQHSSGRASTIPSGNHSDTSPQQSVDQNAMWEAQGARPRTTGGNEQRPRRSQSEHRPHQQPRNSVHRGLSLGARRGGNDGDMTLSSGETLTSNVRYQLAIVPLKNVN